MNTPVFANIVVVLSMVITNRDADNDGHICDILDFVGKIQAVRRPTGWNDSEKTRKTDLKEKKLSEPSAEARERTCQEKEVRSARQEDHEDEEAEGERLKDERRPQPARRRAEGELKQHGATVIPTITPGTRRHGVLMSSHAIFFLPAARRVSTTCAFRRAVVVRPPRDQQGCQQ
jgi:hypothetical protein